MTDSSDRRILGVNGIRLIGNLGGVGRVIEAILRCMDELPHPFDEIRVYSPAPLGPDVQLPTCAHSVVIPSRLPPGLWEQIILPRVHGAKHLLLCPSYVVPVAAWCPMLLIHHGSYEGFPIDYSWWTKTKARVAYQLSAWRAPLVSTVSAHSKRDIMRFYRVAEEKIEVIPNGIDTELFRPIEDTGLKQDWRRRNLGEDIPFILYVGRPDYRRNIPNLVKAFSKAKQAQNLPHKLVLIGTVFQRIPLEAIIRDAGAENDVVCIPHATHEEIALAYNASEMLVYPSSYEGFGMPVLEAMACGTPVISMNNTAFPEFAGGVAELLDDAEVDTLESAMLSLHNDPARREEMAAAGVRRAAEYDWHVVTKRYIELMTRLIEE